MWLPALTDLKGKPACTIQEWLSTANFTPVVAGGDIELQGIDKQHLLRAFAGDLNRVASAASESLRNIVNIDSMPKSLGWPYVKLYYSALFYAHATLRAWGRSPSYLRTSDLLRVRQAFGAQGITPPFKLQTGQYLLSADIPGSCLRITVGKGDGGTHEAVWREFGNSLNHLRSQIATAPYTSTDKSALDAALSAATGLLTNKGANSAWPSAMRNDIQYRQTEGLWYPYKGKNRSTEFSMQTLALLDGKKSVNDFFAIPDDNLGNFRAACSFVIVFARDILADMSHIAGAKSFLRFGQAEFERAVTK